MRRYVSVRGIYMCHLGTFVLLLHKQFAFRANVPGTSSLTSSSTQHGQASWSWVDLLLNCPSDASLHSYHTCSHFLGLISYPDSKVLQVPSLYAEPILQSAEGILHTVVVMSVLTVWFMEGGRSLLIRVPSGTGGRSSLMCMLWVQHVAPLSSPPGLLVWFFIVLFPPISFCTLPTQCLPKMQNLLLAMARLNFISTGEGNLASQQWWTVSGILSLCLRAWFHWKTGFLGAFGELSVLFRFVIQCSFCFPPPTCFPSFNPLPAFSVSFSPQAFSFSSPPGCFVSYPSLVHGEETIEFC